MSVQSELLTVRDFIRYGVSQLNAAQVSFGQGTDNAYDEAVYLVLHSLHLPVDTLTPFLDARVLGQEGEQILKIFEQRITQRVPAAYMTHEAWLGGYRFFVDSRTIIPRSPISTLLEQQLAPWVSQPNKIQSILDLCTGSGCLAILAAIAFPQAQIDAVDISSDALEVAQHNVNDYALQSQITVKLSDLFAQLPANEYDLIICNPPYVTHAAMNRLPEEFQHEPALALAGGTDGMDIIRRIIVQAASFLGPQGLLVLEIGHERAHFVAAFPNLEPIWLDTPAGENQILLLSRELFFRD